MSRTTTVRRAVAATAALAVAGAGAVLVAPSPAQAAKLGNNSLANVLAEDGHEFDDDSADFDVLDAAVAYVLENDPESPVGILAKGRKPLTAFLPNDQAFINIAEDVSGQEGLTEEQAADLLTGVTSPEFVEGVLLYHVVLDKTLPAKQIIKLAKAGKKVKTAAGPKLTLDLKKGKVVIKDADPDAPNAKVVAPNINKGNKQIGHGISQVLRPTDL